MDASLDVADATRKSSQKGGSSVDLVLGSGGMVLESAGVLCQRTIRADARHSMYTAKPAAEKKTYLIEALEGCAAFMLKRGPGERKNGLSFIQFVMTQFVPLNLTC